MTSPPPATPALGGGIAPVTHDPGGVFPGVSDMAARCCAFDWAATPLGPVAGWAPALRAAVRLVLASPAGMSLWCGPAYTLVYNDAYARVLGAKHPGALGQPGAAVWAEIWPEIAPLFDQVRGGGPPVAAERVPFLVARRDGGAGGLEDLEEGWFDYALSAVGDESGAVVAVLSVAADTTAHVRAERALTGANAHLGEQTEAAERARRTADAERARAAGILESMADAYFALDADFRLVAVNAAMARNTGLAPDALLGRLMWDVFPGTAGTSFERHYRAALTEGVEAHFTHDYTDARLDLVTEVDVYPGPAGADGRPSVAVFWRDVTPRVRAAAERDAERERRLAAERAARAAAERERARLAEVLGQLPAGVALTDGPAHRFVLANAAYRATVGGRDVVGKTPVAAFPDLAGQGFHEAVARVYATGVAEHTPEVPATFRDPDGSAREVFIDLSLVPVRDAAGAVAGVLSFHVDATDRVRGAAERARLAAALGAERERLRAVILQMPTPVALHEGPALHFTLVNDAFKRASGGGRDVTGLTPPQAFPELEGQGFYERIARVYATGEPWLGPETPVRFDRDGAGVQDTWFDLRYEPVRDAVGQVTGVLQLTVDVTDQVRARREVERLLADAQAARAEAEGARAAAEQAGARATEANRGKGEFLAVMSHELRTPLNAIGGYAELLELGVHGPVTAEQRTALERIQRSQRHLLGLINGVLNYAKMDAGAVQYAVEEVALAEVLAACEAMVAPQARAKGLTLTHDAPDRWLAGGPLRVRADREKVQQVVLNLLSNAVKFTAPGGRITLAGAAADGVGDPAPVRVTVRDTGIGIAADQLGRVFEPFVQVDARLTRTQEGTGLGLAISRDLARGMGGDLTAESAPGAGSTFTLTLPAA